ncbi:Histamine oxidase [Phytophthora fragariae]|uniref:Amine oxidase n=1 Tax=Phytophthora fragariae TaxID=53985 RepID=A0A6A4C077_9STRA|nr:Histamine oxidase [Phytophthora fragariae]
MEQLLAIDSPEAYATIEETTCAQERTAASPVRQASAATTPVRRDDGHRLEENPDTVDSDQGLKRRQRSCKVCALCKMQQRKYTKYFCPEFSTGNRREGKEKTCYQIWHDDWDSGNTILRYLLQEHKIRNCPPPSRPGKKRRRRAVPNAAAAVTGSEPWAIVQSVQSVLEAVHKTTGLVPYGEPQPTHEWQNYFDDAGEYQFGRLANCLVLGCDWLGKIQYLDATVADDFGDPVLFANAISRRLVISFFVTVGNYDYGFYWYFYLDGRIELECKATGIIFSSGHPEGEYDFATEMAPRLGAPCHQHLFSALLDVAIDGNKCHVDKLEVWRLPISPENPVGNAFKRVVTCLEREGDAQRETDNKLGRAWLIASSEKVNCLGRPTGYVLFPEGAPLLLAEDDSSINKRVQYATKHLRVTQYARDDMWAAGYTPNRHPGHAGLPAYAKANRLVDGEDIVVWYTFGLTHFPRVEDWPAMPVDYTGFSFRPDGFFDHNPTLDVPEGPNGKEFSENCVSSGTSIVAC